MGHNQEPESRKEKCKKMVAGGWGFCHHILAKRDVKA